MATILRTGYMTLEELLGIEEEEVQEDDNKKLSFWVKDGDAIKPSSDVTLLTKLNPGMYEVYFNNQIGYFCREIDITSDELFVFTNSILTNLLEEIELFWEKALVYRENNLIHKRGILLEGFPGTGKSSIITLLSNMIIEKEGVVFRIQDWENFSEYVHFIKNYFRKLQPYTPIITIIEDIDQYDRVESELLDFLDGKSNIEHHVVIATTNDTSQIPDTYLRPSRIDIKVEIPLPDDETRREYFKFKNVPENDLDSLVESTSKLSIADLKELYISRYVLDYGIEEAVQKIRSPKTKKNYLRNPATESKIGF